MIIALFMRRWCILALGGVLLLLGLAVLYAHAMFAFDWIGYSPATIAAFFPGLPSAGGQYFDGAAMASPVRVASIGAQVSLALGVALISGWIGFALGSIAGPSRKQ